MRTSETSDIARYVESLYAIEDEPLRAIRDRIVSAGRRPINITASEGRIIQVMMRLSKVSRAVEIGTLFGYSGVWIARALEVGGQLFTIERDRECVKAAAQSFKECGVSERVKILEGEATEMLATVSKDGPFDLVFIDANKSAYVEYLEWAHANLRSGGLVIADNTILGGAVLEAEKPERISNAQWAEMRKFNELIADPIRFMSTIIPTAEGLTVAIRL